jgi:uncharacterized membrane protein YoaT (DUF817 family)
MIDTFLNHKYELLIIVSVAISLYLLIMGLKRSDEKGLFMLIFGLIFFVGTLCGIDYYLNGDNDNFHEKNEYKKDR